MTNAEEMRAHQPVAVYLRMSTEHQRYSIDNQLVAIMAYAVTRGMEIVQTYADRGKSGLTIERRPALTQLLQDVLAGRNAFCGLLVYDVSRWGRFQDVDESAHYEFLLRQAGVPVAYCAEPFENDGTPMAAIFKNLKRVMAGEYSRELSAKVFAGQCRVASLGYRTGGPPGYGLRRLLIDSNDEPKGILRHGQRKSLATDRVVLVPGPAREIAVVRLIFKLYVDDGLSKNAIVAGLNKQRIRSRVGPTWGKQSVDNVLRNEAYIGNNTYNRTSKKLRQVVVHNPPDRWVRAEGVGKSVIDPDLFHRAQVLLAAHADPDRRAVMLEDLRRVLREDGRIVALTIRRPRFRYSYWNYLREFGSVLNAYRLIGHAPDADYAYVEQNGALCEIRRSLLGQIADAAMASGRVVTRRPRGSLQLDRQSVDVLIVRCLRTKCARNPKWRISPHPRRTTTTVAARMNEGNTGVEDFYVVPSRLISDRRAYLAKDGSGALASYRVEQLPHVLERLGIGPVSQDVS